MVKLRDVNPITSVAARKRKFSHIPAVAVRIDEIAVLFLRWTKLRKTISPEMAALVNLSRRATLIAGALPGLMPMSHLAECKNSSKLNRSVSLILSLPTT